VYKDDREFKTSMWSIGKVVQVTTDPHDRSRTIAVSIKFINDITVSQLSCKVDSDLIAPLNSKR
jgi:hypothetical protein